VSTAIELISRELTRLRKPTIVKAAFVDLIFGRSFSALGAAGGRAAIWGAAASGDREDALGMTTGGESANGGWGRSR